MSKRPVTHERKRRPVGDGAFTFDGGALLGLILALVIMAYEKARGAVLGVWQAFWKWIAL